MALVKIIQKKQAATRVKKITALESPSTVVIKKPRVTARKKVIKEISPDEIVPSEYVLGAWVILNGPISPMWEGTYQKMLRKDQVPCKITATPNGRAVNPAETTEQVLGLMSSAYGNNRANPTNYLSKGLKLISKKDAEDRLTALREKGEKEYNTTLENAMKVFSTKHVPILERKDYDLKVGMDTNFNYLALGKAQKDWSFVINANNKYQGARCCALSKTDMDIITWIPKSWLNYMGYNKKDLETWIDFCTNLGIGFEAKLTKEVKMMDIFGQGFQYQPIPANINSNIRSLFFLPRTEEAYEVVLKGSVRMKTYMHFILLRYIYNNFYSTIPFTAMQLKMKLRDKASFWECLLLAHNNVSKTGSYTNYYGYYCLAACTETSSVFGDAKNSIKAVMDRVTSGNYDMNSSFKLSNYRTNDVSNLLRTGTNEQLLKLIEERRGK